MIFTVRTEIEPAYEDEFNEWQYEEHIPWVRGSEKFMILHYLRTSEAEAGKVWKELRA
jgi:hypothetical protein